jgi:prepilin-type N-terminal cleavage/methylation domain-containing protein
MREFPNRTRRARNEPEPDRGFTLIELLIVSVVMPLIVGALAAGLLAVFSLQSSASNRLGDTGDAQVVSSRFAPDVQGAQEITTQSSPTACGSGNQVLGLEWNLQTNGDYNTVVSYVEVPSGITSSGTATYNLARQECDNGGATVTSTTILSFDVPSSMAAPSITCTSTISNCASVTTGWLATTGVEDVVFPITEPNSTYSYTLTADPAATSTVSDAGGPIKVNATSGCDFATAGSGPLASSLCLIDFNNLLSNPALLADAETPTSCLEESVPLNGSFTLYFCMSITNSISGEIIASFALPTWCGAFLGNPGTSGACGATGVYPNYYGVSGAPALYQQGTCEACNNGGVTTVALTKIEIVNGSGTPAKGWELFSADAESTDNGSGYQESITWNSDQNLSIISNGYTAANGYCIAGTPCDTASAPFGTACDGGGSWTVGVSTYYGIAGTGDDMTNYFANPGGTKTIECTVPPSGSVTLSGTAMVEALSPHSMSATLGDGPGGLEAVVFGVLSS